jgi:hypothetical protein
MFFELCSGPFPDDRAVARGPQSSGPRTPRGAHDLLGFTATVGLADGIAELAEWLASQTAEDRAKSPRTSSGRADSRASSFRSSSTAARWPRAHWMLCEIDFSRRGKETAVCNDSPRLLVTVLLCGPGADAATGACCCGGSVRRRPADRETSADLKGRWDC